jgi:hypothetical protein
MDHFRKATAILSECYTHAISHIYHRIEEETWDDWVDESQDAVPVKSFFTEEILPSIQALLAHAVNKCKFDLKAYLQKNAINAKGSPN